MSLVAYKDWNPTPFDTPGLGNAIPADFLVVPMSRTRDSFEEEIQEFENIQNKLAEFGPEHEESEPAGDWRTDRFGHWACGWFEILTVRPDSRAHKWVLDNVEGAQ